jgi:predicted nucleic acid-binding protein
MPKAKVKKYSQKWYYDACALDYDLDVYGEMTSKNNPKQIVLSHLALGEAYGNCYLDGEEKARLFIQLLERLREIFNKHQMLIVRNENIYKQFGKVREHFEVLDIADAMHIATALKHKCNNIRTIDSDLAGLQKLKVRQLGEEFEIDNFVITKIEKNRIKKPRLRGFLVYSENLYF